MAYEGAAIGAGVPPYAVALAERGRAGRLVIYAGAGLSHAEPAGLPLGAEVANRVHHRLRGAFPVIEACDADDLLAVADAIAALPGGEDALRFTAARAAEFTTATPTYGHEILALLLLEGLLDVLTTNWDNCIERAGGSELVSAIVTEQDLLGVVSRAVLKIHGCASQPTSLLITTQRLTSPPSWVSDQTRARLGMSVVVFVGIGDVAGYVRVRLQEAIAEIGNTSNLRVVSPGIGDHWAASKWAELVPTLDAEYRLAESADAFLDKLGAAYVLMMLGDVSTALVTEPALAESFDAAFTALKKHDSLTVLAWVRNAAVVATVGRSVLAEPSMATALMALGKLAGADFTIDRDSLAITPDGPLDILVAVGTQTASRIRREAQNRLVRHVGNGREPRFVVAGGMGWTSGDQLAVDDILGGGALGDMVDGPLNARARIVRAESILTP